jgi:serine protease Do
VAKEIYERLKENGRVARGWLGVQLQDIKPDVAERLGLKGHTGAFLADVLPGSPAEEAGLRGGDLIVEFNGQKVADNAELPLLVAGAQIGSSVKVKALRNGQPIELTVKIAERADDVTPRQ